MASKSLESVVEAFEHSINSTDSKLDQLSWRVDTFELRNVNSVVEDASGVTEEDGITSEASEEEIILLRELLVELDQLKRSYASLRSELQQVHTMHADLTHALRQKVVQVQDVFSNLRTRFTKHCRNEILE